MTCISNEDIRLAPLVIVIRVLIQATAPTANITNFQSMPATLIHGTFRDAATSAYSLSTPSGRPPSSVLAMGCKALQALCCPAELALGCRLLPQIDEFNLSNRRAKLQVTRDASLGKGVGECSARSPDKFGVHRPHRAVG